MNIEEIREYCIAKKGVTESFPFDDTGLVFKVMDKMFGLLALESHRLSLKNLPDKNMELRAEYSSIIPGYHFNKQHWNTIELDGSIPVKLLQEMIDESYNLVVQKLTRKQKDELEKL